MPVTRSRLVERLASSADITAREGPVRESLNPRTGDVAAVDAKSASAHVDFCDMVRPQRSCLAAFERRIDHSICHKRIPSRMIVRSATPGAMAL